MFSPDLKFPITFLSLMLYVFANQAAFSVLSNFTTTPGEFPLTKEPEDSGYEIWFRLASRFAQPLFLRLNRLEKSLKLWYILVT